MKIFVLTLSLFSFIIIQAQTPVVYFISYKEKVPGSEFSFKMVPVSGGSFLMGSNDKEKAREADEGPQKKIVIEPFWMGAFEVSRDEFDVFYKDENTSQNSKVDAITRPSPQYIDMSLGMGKEGGFPVNSLSQHAALMYCRWLYNKTGIFYRLPTEAEWEYACRAGSNTTYYFGNDTSQLSNYAWYASNSDNKFHKSGEKLPNAWGLYDMLGNVSEWTLDHYDAKALDKIQNNSIGNIPTANMAKYPKVTRGGSYEDATDALRCANRQPSDPSWNRRDPQIPKSKWWLTEAAFVGFRLLRPQQQPTAEQVDEFFKEYLGN
ncbi:MAG: SUMF1/EgtB/PvdO family nonheme iron enzyme [Ferruginibacter sp.]